MEKLGTMLSKRQFMLVKKSLESNKENSVPVSKEANLQLITQIGNKKYYREVGTTHRWQFDFQDGAIIGVHRNLNYFTV